MKDFFNDSEIVYRVNPSITNDQLNALFDSSWDGHTPSDFNSILQHSLAIVGAFHSTRLIGFVNIAWDGGIHAFILDTTVHFEYRRRGIGQMLVQLAAQTAKENGIEWLHVDFEPHLQKFYDDCGFQFTNAGLMNLRETG